MNDPYKRRHLEQRITKDADQTEFAAMRQDFVLIDAGLFDDRVSGALDDFEFSDSNLSNWHLQDLQFDTAGGEISNEISRRSQLLGDAYPFEVNSSQIRYKASKSYFYEFCLATSITSNLTEGTNVYFPRYFERTTAIILKKYFGDNSRSLHVGAPRDTETGTTFFSAMQRVNKLTNEWIWEPTNPYPNEPSTSGDEGLDFIVWKETPDKRLGNLFMLGQCACGEDWKNKFDDLNIKKLSKWFNPISYVEPLIRAFATPYHLTDFNLIDAQNQAGIVFDRARLAIIAEQFSNDQELIDWRPKIEEIAKKIIFSN